MTNLAISTHLRQEQSILAALLDDRPHKDFVQKGPYFNWTPLQVVIHLWFIDHLAIHTLTESSQAQTLLSAFAKATQNSRDEALFRKMYLFQNDVMQEAGQAENPVEAWKMQAEVLNSLFDSRRYDDTTTWFGRPYKVGRLVDARHMEVWAYGQDIFDTWKQDHTVAPGLKQVADFSVRTLRFSFANRGLSPPDILPHIELITPDGEALRWNQPSDSNLIRGKIDDFCLVTTQRRHVSDTKIEARGDTANTWLKIAQCISGPPLDGPKPGERVWRSSQSIAG